MKTEEIHGRDRTPCGPELQNACCPDGIQRHRRAQTKKGDYIEHMQPIICSFFVVLFVWFFESWCVKLVSIINNIFNVI